MPTNALKNLRPFSSWRPIWVSFESYRMGVDQRKGPIANSVLANNPKQAIMIVSIPIGLIFPSIFEAS